MNDTQMVCRDGKCIPINNNEALAIEILDLQNQINKMKSDGSDD